MKVNLPNYGVFDERRLFAPGPPPGSRQLPRRAHRRADLRGHLDRVGRLRGRGRMPRRDRSRAPCRAQRLAVLARQGGGSAQHRGRARHRKRAAAHLCQPDRRPGRAGVRWRLVRAACRSLARVPAPGVSRRSSRRCVWERRGNGWRCVDAPVAAIEEGDKADYLACMLGLRDYVNKNGFKGVVLGLSGGVDFRPGGGAGGRCAGRRPRALRDAAVSLHVAGIARRCGAASRRRLACNTTWCRSKARYWGWRKRWRRSSRACRATSPRKICRRAHAAPS